MPESSPQRDPHSARPAFALTEEHRMLLRIRDTLYEGRWDDFKRDLEARRAARPHVFNTVPDSPQMLRTIGNHLELIDQMAEWERTNGRDLSAGLAGPDVDTGGPLPRT